MGLYDSIGRLLHTYFDKPHAAGEYEFEMDLRGLTTGNYVVQLRSSLKSDTQVLHVL